MFDLVSPRPSRHPLLAICVVLLTSTACDAPPPVDVTPACQAYVACFLARDAAGIRALADAANDDDNVESDALRCYAGYAGESGRTHIAALQATYPAAGSCWRRDLQAPAGSGLDDDDLVAATVAACTSACEHELRADCRRRAEGGLGVCALSESDIDSCDVVGIDLTSIDGDDPDEDAARERLPSCAERAP